MLFDYIQNMQSAHIVTINMNCYPGQKKKKEQLNST